MPVSRLAMICVVLSVVFAIACNPRVFYGNGGGSAVFSLDDYFFWGQWAAFVLAVLATIMSWPGWIGDGRIFTVRALWVPLLSLFMSAYLLVTGVPHRANQYMWRTGATGLVAFVKGMSKDHAANAPPPTLRANSFAGDWRALDGRVYRFGSDSVTVIAPSGTTIKSMATCNGRFSINYTQRGRETLQDNGLTWSKHANAVYDLAAVDAKIPVAELMCDNDVKVFVRATSAEVWRWTSALTLDDIKSDAFVLKSDN